MAKLSGRQTAWSSARATLAWNPGRLAPSVSAGQSAPEDEEQQLIDRLGRHLHPEVLARFNGILDYRSLNLETKWKVWLSLGQDLVLRIGPGTQIVLAAAAKRLVQERLAETTGGARTVIDLFRREIIPLALGAKQGDVIRVTVGETNRLQRVANETKK